MEKQSVLFTISVLALAFLFSACQKSATENSQDEFQTLPTVLPITGLSPTPSMNSDSPIRKVDFKNFTFPETNDYPRFRLKDGEKPFEFGKKDGIDLFKIEYLDLTSDRNEEAILTMSIQTGGSAMPNFIFIYTLENEEPKLLWNFMTGDRASGGLKKVYGANDDLIVETFGDNKFINGEWKFDYPKGEFRGDCCPTAYTKIRFKWDGKKFVIQGSPELFNYDRSEEMKKSQ